MGKLKRWAALSEDPLARRIRAMRRAVLHFSVPAPALVARPLLAAFLALRNCYFFLIRVFVCEPLFKAYCTQYGRGLRTGVFIHWVQGSGKIIAGDDVLVDGKCSFAFAMRYAPDPSLSIGSHTVISNACSFTVGRQITVGEHCLIAEGVLMFDAPGHPTDPVRRKAGAPADLDDVRPIHIQDNVWIGRRATIFPGVTVGEGSVVVMGSSVMNDVPPYCVVAGDPARVIRRLPGRDGASDADEPAAALVSLAAHIGRPAEISRPSASMSPGASLNRVVEILKQVVGTGELQPDEDFYDAGVTSIMTLPLLIELEQKFGVTIPEDEFLSARTGRQLAGLVDGLVMLTSRRV